MMNNVIPVVMSFDENYLFPFLITLFSLLTNAAENVRYELYILMDQDNTDLGREDLDNYKKHFPGFEYHYCYIDYSVFAGLNLYDDYLSVATFGRLLIDQLVTEHDYCLYLDSDLLILEDLSSLYDEYTHSKAMNDMYIAAVRDYTIQTRTDQFYTDVRDSIGFSKDDIRHYFNAGVLIMNLKKMRQDHIRNRFLSLVRNNYTFNDQDILNIVCKNKALFFSVRYNYLTPWINDLRLASNTLVPPEEHNALIANSPAVYHFASREKPWLNIETPEEVLWYGYAHNAPVISLKMKEKVRQLDEMNTSGFWSESRNAAMNSEKLIIYGFTYISRNITDELLFEGFKNISCYIDQNQKKWDRNYRGIPCTGFDIPDDYRDSASFLICAQTAWPEIYADLKKAGIAENRIFRYRLRDHRIIQRIQN